MTRRLELQTLLEEVLGSENVYFQPPESLKMSYPAIVYSRSDVDHLHADDVGYIQTRAYQVIVIDRDPDSTIVDAIAQLPMCRFGRHYTADNLNHDVFTLYF